MAKLGTPFPASIATTKNGSHLRRSPKIPFPYLSYLSGINVPPHIHFSIIISSKEQAEKAQPVLSLLPRTPKPMPFPNRGLQKQCSYQLCNQEIRNPVFHSDPQCPVIKNIIVAHVGIIPIPPPLDPPPELP
jgi:hypothetical protein